MPRESQLTFSSEEILADVVTCEALVVKGVKCHGGFDADGHYRSPRTRFRVPAIEAWQAQHLATSGAPLFEIPADLISPHLPNVAQAKFLLRSGVREPMIRTLTEIAIVEGFGAMIRELSVPPLRKAPTAPSPSRLRSIAARSRRWKSASSSPTERAWSSS